MKPNTYTRDCPNCNGEIRYTRKNALVAATKNKSKCAICVVSGKNHPMYGKHHPVSARKRMSKSHIGIAPWNKGKTNVYSEEVLENMRKKLSNIHRGAGNPFYGKHHSKKTKILLARQSRERRLNCVTPAIGRNEKRILDGIEQQKGIQIDRDFRVIGYKPDGYCHETNTIYDSLPPRKHTMFNRVMNWGSENI